jgi:phosphoglycolate phosphatase-like HAD superfamily hydrolase
MPLSCPQQIVIFDNDGTLVPSHEVANPAIQKGFHLFCTQRGIDLDVPSDERLRELTGQPGEVFYQQLLPDRWRHLADDLRSFCLDHEVREMLRHAQFYPGIERLLSALRTLGCRLAIATNGGRRYIGAVAERLGYDHLFDRVYYHGFDGLTSKEQMARRAIKELGPGAAVFVGDRRSDAEAAKECGIPFLGCLYGYGSREELKGAIVLVNSPEELFAHLLPPDRSS